jgi:hypothetical protein
MLAGSHWRFMGPAADIRNEEGCQLMRRALLECDPDAPLFAPNNMARKARTVYDKHEIVRDANWARHIELYVAP